MVRKERKEREEREELMELLVPNELIWLKELTELKVPKRQGRAPGRADRSLRPNWSRT
jgi:hypothetical protein